MQGLQRLSAIGVAALGMATALAAIENGADAAVGTQDLLLRAEGRQPTKLEGDKMRVPIDVDGVVYEVIVARPGSPSLAPAARDR